MRLARAPRKKARIEIIPMIDTMFFLLVFFMVATLSMTDQRGLAVNLPHGTSGRSGERQVAALTLTKEGKLYLDREEVASPADAALMLGHRERDDSRPLTVTINADKKVEHGRVIEVMDAVKREGITRVAIAVTPH
jgi:biopolymer transport protein ExbD